MAVPALRLRVSKLVLLTGGFFAGHAMAVLFALLVLTPLAVPAPPTPTVPAAVALTGAEDAPPRFHTPPVFEWQPQPPAPAAPAADPDQPPPPRSAMRAGRQREHAPGVADTTAPSPAPLDMSARARAHREVRRDDDGVYLIPRDVLMTVANDRALMRSQARRVTPWFEDGAVQGVRVEGAGALLGLVGIRDGDIITRAGGIIIDSPHRGLAAWDTLRARSEVQLEVLRRGRRIQLRYRLVDAAPGEGSSSP